MKIVIKTTNLKLDKELSQYIGEKINSLEKFSKILYNEKYFNHLLERQRRVKKRIYPLCLPERSEGWRRANTLRLFGKGKPRVEAWVEIGKETMHHKKGPFFWAECQMRFPKRSLRSTARAEDLKLAITEVKDELQRQLKQYKEKLTAQTKRRARVLKKELKLAPQARFYRKGRVKEEGI